MYHSRVSSLFSDMQRLRKDLDTYFHIPQGRQGIRSQRGPGTPPVVLGENSEEVRVVLFAPGLDEKTLDVTVQGEMLRVQGDYKNQSHVRNEETEQGRKVTEHRRERPTGRFTRVFSLPESADTNKTHATYKEGLLQLVFAKKIEAKSRKIELQNHTNS
jgi:HSP20 family protein